MAVVAACIIIQVSAHGCSGNTIMWGNFGLAADAIKKREERVGKDSIKVTCSLP